MNVDKWELSKIIMEESAKYQKEFHDWLDFEKIENKAFYWCRFVMLKNRILKRIKELK